MVEVVLIAAADQDKIKIRSSAKLTTQQHDHVIDGWYANKLEFPFHPLINTLASVPHFLSNHGPLWIDSCRGYAISFVSATNFFLLFCSVRVRPPNGTRTGASCLIGCFDPMRLNRKYTTQLLALCCRGYWTGSIRQCSRT